MPTEFDPLHLRNVAGSFATGVAVITVHLGNSQIKGMTANSFLSVSLDPALVLFSVDKKTSFLKYLSVQKHVGISILSNQQKLISNFFAGFETENIELSFEWIDECPIVASCLAWYSSRIVRTIDAGDHKLILCEIIHCERNESDPLVFYNGYRNIGEKI